MTKYKQDVQDKTIVFIDGILLCGVYTERSK